MIHTIITDFDGTLVDTFKANLLAYQMAFHEVGMTLTEEKYKDCFGYRFECFMAAMKITNEKIANHIRETKKQYYPQYFKYLKINTPLLELIRSFRNIYNPQIQISAESETKRSIFREKDKTKRSKKESAQHSKSRNKSFVMTSVSAL